MKAIMGLAVVILIGICSIFFMSRNKQLQEEENLKKIWSEATHELDEFQSKIMGLRTSSTTKAELQQELANLKRYAQDSSRKINELKTRSSMNKNENAPQVTETLRKIQKYTDGYAAMANLSINEKEMQAKASTMLNATDYLNEHAHFLGAPDSGDTTQALALVSKITKKFNQSNSIATLKPLAATEKINPEYNEYYAAIQELIRNYQKGRDTLAYVLKHYDSGNLSTSDIQKWRQELVRRQALLASLIALDHLAPAGNANHYHQLFKQVLADAIDVMKDFGDSQNYSTRQTITIVSDRNTKLLRKIKYYFGVSQ